MNLSIAPLFSSSSGNATYIGSEETGILIDAGVTGKNMEAALKSIDKKPERLKGILITHEHVDHIKGAGILSRKYNIPIYANRATWECICDKIGEIRERNMRLIDECDFFIGDLTITPIPLSHDAADPAGYSVYANGKRVSVLTDTGRVTEDMLKKAAGSDIILLEANHDVEMLKCGKYPYNLKTRILSTKGHLSNEDSGRAAVELVKRGVRGILLGHLSRENNFDELAKKTVEDALIKEAIIPGRDVALKTANKLEVTGFFSI